MDLREPSRSGPGVTAPRSARAAGVLLLVLGLANVGVAIWALVAGSDEIRTGVALGLAVAGAVTVGLGVLVRRAHRGAVYTALIVFELLLIPRLMTLGEPGTGAWASLVVLVCLVALLWVAAVAVRRHGRGPVDGTSADPVRPDAL